MKERIVMTSDFPREVTLYKASNSCNVYRRAKPIGQKIGENYIPGYEYIKRILPESKKIEKTYEIYYAGTMSIDNGGALLYISNIPKKIERPIICHKGHENISKIWDLRIEMTEYDDFKATFYLK